MLKIELSKQADFNLQIEEHTQANGNYYLTAAKILDLCKRAVEIFDSSELNEKRQFLNFLLQNSRLNGKTPVFTLKPVFASIVSANKNLFGSGGGIRTHNQSINSRLLYR